MSGSAGARRIAVVGAGLSGLAAAHHLVELSAAAAAGAAARPAGPVPALTFRVYEASPRAGGIVATTRMDDLVIEDGPDSFITDKPEAIALLERIGLGPRIIATRPEYRRSYVVARGRLERTPDGFQLLAPTRLRALLASPILSWPGRLRAALEPFVPARTRDVDAIVDESLADFVTRRLGHELFERLAQPMVGGIYGADPARLSLLATFPRFLRLEAEHGSVIRGLARAAARARAAGAAGAVPASGPRYALFASLAGGMQEMTDALAARLPAGALRLSTPVTGLAPLPGGGFRLTTVAGDEDVEAAILTLAGPVTARLIAPFDPDLAARLAAFPRGSSVVATFAFAAGDLAHPRDGAGFVVPRREGRLLIGCSFTDRKFAGRAPADVALLRTFFDERALALDDAALVARARSELGVLLGLRADAVARAVRVVRWPGAMPHYHVGHLERVAALRAGVARWPGLHLAGHSWTGVGLPDCVRSGEEAARAAARPAG